MWSTPEEVVGLQTAALAELAVIGTEEAAEAFRIKYLGKKGLVRSVMQGLGALPAESRRTVGAAVNALNRVLEERFEAAPWRASAQSVPREFFDYSLPGVPFGQGALHPLMKVRQEMVDIFISMGFDVAEGPEVELDYYNFEALNFQPHHPARDMQDTFYVADKVLLRTHTSPVQVRVMEHQKPPIRSIMPGRVYRNEQISTRSYCLFHQVEGLYIDRDVSFADLKATLLGFSRRFFGSGTDIKVRPSYFPFTEPSVEVDVRCYLCKGNGCGLCKKSGWLEILGAGMVHPNVLKGGGIDPEEFTGFAFGMGVERIALLRYGIDDIRLLFENDAKFVKQF